jgi:hypothetical protein
VARRLLVGRPASHPVTVGVVGMCTRMLAKAPKPMAVL